MTKQINETKPRILCNGQYHEKYSFLSFLDSSSEDSLKIDFIEFGLIKNSKTISYIENLIHNLVGVKNVEIYNLNLKSNLIFENFDLDSLKIYDSKFSEIRIKDSKINDLDIYRTQLSNFEISKSFIRYIDLSSLAEIDNTNIYKSFSKALNIYNTKSFLNLTKTNLTEVFLEKSKISLTNHISNFCELSLEESEVNVESNINVELIHVEGNSTLNIDRKGGFYDLNGIWALNNSCISLDSSSSVNISYKIKHLSFNDLLNNKILRIKSLGDSFNLDKRKSNIDIDSNIPFIIVDVNDSLNELEITHNEKLNKILTYTTATFSINNDFEPTNSKIEALEQFVATDLEEIEFMTKQSRSFAHVYTKQLNYNKPEK